MSTPRATQLVEAGLWLRLSGDQEGARRLFEQALKLDPTNARARQLLETSPPEEQAAPQPNKPTTRLPATVVQFAAPTPVISPVAPRPPAPNPFVRQDRPSPSPSEASSAPEPDRRDLIIEAPPLVSNATSAWDHKSNPGVHLSSIAPSTGSAFDLVAEDEVLVAAPLPPDAPAGAEELHGEVETLLRGARDLLELDDHSGAMDLINKALELSPNDPEVLKMRERSEHTLQAMFESKLGSLDATPRVALKDDEIIWLNLDHRAGFVLAQIDGTVTFEDLFAVSGMSRLDTARILAQLVEEGVIGPGS